MLRCGLNHYYHIKRKKVKRKKKCQWLTHLLVWISREKTKIKKCSLSHDIHTAHKISLYWNVFCAFFIVCHLSTIWRILQPPKLICLAPALKPLNQFHKKIVNERMQRTQLVHSYGIQSNSDLAAIATIVVVHIGQGHFGLKSEKRMK